VQPFPDARRPIEKHLRNRPPLRSQRVSDPGLVKQARDGDERALAALCGRYPPPVEHLCQGLLVDGEETRDASQEALATVCARLGQSRGEARLSTWPYRLAATTCRDLAEGERAILPNEGVGYSSAEVASLVGMPMGRPKRDAHRARRALRARREGA
jgi:DNA-directed RNA polymerase specialized sigma24 family protein